MFPRRRSSVHIISICDACVFLSCKFHFMFKLDVVITLMLAVSTRLAAAYNRASKRPQLQIELQNNDNNNNCPTNSWYPSYQPACPTVSAKMCPSLQVPILYPSHDKSPSRKANWSHKWVGKQYTLSLSQCLFSGHINLNTWYVWRLPFSLSISVCLVSI